MNAALLVTVDDSVQCARQISKRIDGIQFAGLNERGDGRPVLSPRVMSSKKCILAIESNRPDGPLYGIVVDFDAPVGQEELQAIPVSSYVC